MINSKFIYGDKETIIQSNLNDKMEEIIKKFGDQSKKNIKLLFFLVEDKRLNEELSLEKNLKNISLEEDKIKALKEIKIIVKDKRFIICPKCPVCKEFIKINIFNYRIYFNKCKNNHTIDSKLIKEFNKKDNQYEIVCNECSKNKGLYYCKNCSIYLCSLCFENHNKGDDVKKLFQCNIHDKSYNSYCMQCKKDLCEDCQQEHNNHNIYNELLPNINECRNNLNELRKSINGLEKKINEIINNLENIIENLEDYYYINNGIINNYDKENINYEILSNIKEINKNNISIIEDINNINNDNNIINKIYNIYKKMYEKIDEITIIYENIDIKKKKKMLKFKYLVLILPKIIKITVK